MGPPRKHSKPPIGHGGPSPAPGIPRYIGPA